MNNKKCPIHGKGESRRNFIHVNDVCSAIDTVLNDGQVNEIYNIGTTNEYTVIQIFHKLCKSLIPNKNPSDYIEYVKDRCFNDFRYCIDSTKLKNLGWTEKVKFEDGLHSTIEHYLNNFEYYESKLQENN